MIKRFLKGMETYMPVIVFSLLIILLEDLGKNINESDRPLVLAEIGEIVQKYVGEGANQTTNQANKSEGLK